MKRKVILIFIFFLSVNSLKSQGNQLLEEDKHWIFLSHQENDAGVNILSGFVVNIKGDTIIDGIAYKKLYSYNLKGQHNCQFPPCFTPNYPYEIEGGTLYAIMREDAQNGIVYHYNQLGENCVGEYELFNFGQIVGDTINSCVRDKIAIEDKDGIIDSISTVDIFNSQRKIIYTSGDAVFEGLPYSSKLKIIEGIGFEIYGFFAGTQDELVEVCFGSLDECNIISSVNKIEIAPEVKLFPNPVYDQLNIHCEIKIKKISIVDSNGKEVFVGDPENIRMEMLRPGIYFLRLIFENNELITNKIVKMY